MIRPCWIPSNGH